MYMLIWILKSHSIVTGWLFKIAAKFSVNTITVWWVLTYQHGNDTSYKTSLHIDSEAYICAMMLNQIVCLQLNLLNILIMKIKSSHLLLSIAFVWAMHTSMYSYMITLCTMFTIAYKTYYWKSSKLHTFLPASNSVGLMSITV